MKKIIIFLLSFVALVSCNTFSDVGKVLRNEKTNTEVSFIFQKPLLQQHQQQPTTHDEDEFLLFCFSLPTSPYLQAGL